jgi:hypothetical protein
MARGQHRFRNRRLKGEKKIQAAARAINSDAKRGERIRRDAAVPARIKACLAAGTATLPAFAQSWLSRKTGKPFGKLSQAAIAAAIG